MSPDVGAGGAHELDALPNSQVKHNNFDPRSIMRPRHWKLPSQHPEAVKAVAVTGNGKYIFSGCKDDKVRIFEKSSGKVFQVFGDHTNDVCCLAVAEKPINGSSINSNLMGAEEHYYLASGGWDRTIHFYVGHITTFNGTPEWTTQHHHVLSEHTGCVMSMDFSVILGVLVSGSRDKTVRVWSIASGTLMQTIEGKRLSTVPEPPDAHTGEVTTVAVSHDGQFAVSSSDDRVILLWKVLQTSGGVRLEYQKAMRGHTLKVRSIDISSTAKYIVSGSNDLTVRLWDVNSGREVKCLREHTGIVTSVLFSRFDDFIVTGSDDRWVVVWDLASMTVLRKFSGHNLIVTSVAMDRECSFILSASNDMQICVWDLTSSVTLKSFFPKPTQTVYAMELFPDSQRVVVCSSFSLIQMYQAKNRALLYEIRGESQARSVCCSPNSTEFATGHEDGCARIWSLEGKLLHTIDITNEFVTSARYLGPDTILFAYSDVVTCFRLMRRSADALSHEHIDVEHSRHGELVRSIAVSPTNEFAASCGLDDCVIIWNARNMRVVSKLPHSKEILSVSFSAEGAFIASGGKDNYLRIFARNFKEVADEKEPNKRKIMYLMDYSLDVVFQQDCFSDILQVAFVGKSALVVFTNDSHLRIFSIGHTTEKEETWRLGRQAYLLHFPQPPTEKFKGFSITPGGECIAISWGRSLFVDSADDLIGCVFNSHSIPSHVLVNFIKHILRPDSTIKEKAEVDQCKDLVTVNRWSFFFHKEAYFAELANDMSSEDIFYEGLKHLFSTHLPVNPIRFGILLYLALTTRSILNIRSVLEQLLFSMDAHNKFAQHALSDVRWVLSNSDKDIEMCGALIKIGELYPSVLSEFLNQAPLLLADDSVNEGFGNQVVFPGNDLYVMGTATAAPTGCWRELFAQQPLQFLRALFNPSRWGELEDRWYELFSTSPAGKGKLVDSSTGQQFFQPDTSDDDTSMNSVLSAISFDSKMKRTDSMVIPFPFLSSSRELYRRQFERSRLFKLIGQMNVSENLQLLNVNSSFVDGLIKTSNAEFFDNTIVRAILQYRWSRFGKAGQIREVSYFLFGLAAMIVLSLTLEEGIPFYTIRDTAPSSPKEIVIVASFAIFTIFALTDAYGEMRQVFRLSRQLSLYVSDVWNLFDVSDAICSLIFVGLFLAQLGAATPLLAVVVYLRWIRVLKQLQPFGSTGPLVRMILAIFWDIRWFLFTLSVALIAATHSIYLLRTNEDCDDLTVPCRFSDPAESFFTLFNTILFASYEIDEIVAGEYRLLVQFVFFFSMLTIPIVFLNLLIGKFVMSRRFGFG